MRYVESLRRRRGHWLWFLVQVCLACARAIRDSCPARGLTAIRRVVYDVSTLSEWRQLEFLR